jgi:hypothetical protein
MYDWSEAMKDDVWTNLFPDTSASIPGVIMLRSN